MHIIEWDVWYINENINRVTYYLHMVVLPPSLGQDRSPKTQSQAFSTAVEF